jgi:hypothetical protein
MTPPSRTSCTSAACRSTATLRGSYTRRPPTWPARLRRGRLPRRLSGLHHHRRPVRAAVEYGQGRAAYWAGHRRCPPAAASRAPQRRRAADVFRCGAPVWHAAFGGGLDSRSRSWVSALGWSDAIVCGSPGTPPSPEPLRTWAAQRVCGVARGRVGAGRCRIRRSRAWLGRARCGRSTGGRAAGWAGVSGRWRGCRWRIRC